MNKQFLSVLFGASLLALPALAAGSSTNSSTSSDVSPSINSTSSDVKGSASGSMGSSSAMGSTASASSDMIGKSVVDQKGAKIGTVKDVRADASGANQVIVGVGTKDVALPASDLQMASNDQLQSSKTLKDIKKLPAAEGSSSSSSSTGASPSMNSPSSASPSGAGSPSETSPTGSTTPRTY